MSVRKPEVIIVGGGMAGLSAAIYLGRARRDTLVIDSEKSMARWEPDVRNYLGFPGGISGTDLLRRSRRQARNSGAKLVRDEIKNAGRDDAEFHLKGQKQNYACKRLLLATGIFHIPPTIRGIRPCLGHSMFFCKDCDGHRVEGKSVAIYGWSDETVDYALGMLLYSPCVTILCDGHSPRWTEQHGRWVREYEIPVCGQNIIGVRREGSALQTVRLADGIEVKLDALFTTRGDVYFNALARQLGARVDAEGQIVVDADMRTTVAGLYAAGCVTPANCQMIIAAGQGATAGQAINRDLFEESLATHSLRRFRLRQLQKEKTRPVMAL